MAVPHEVVQTQTPQCGPKIGIGPVDSHQDARAVGERNEWQKHRPWVGAATDPCEVDVHLLRESVRDGAG